MRPWHALTWVVWAIAGTAALQLAPSPVYVVLVIALAFAVVREFGGTGGYARAFPVLVGAAVVFALLRVVLAALTTHGGPHVLVTLPSVSLPDWVGGFAVGGTIEAPVVVQAATEGFVIVGVIALFAALNAVASHHELVQALPRAFHEVGLVLAVGIAFVPSTITAIRDVRAADRARTGGRVVRRGRFVRQLVPVIDLGLERALTLSESMDSRGFARGAVQGRERTSGWLGVVGLLALGAAFVALVAGGTTVAGVLALVGVAGIVGAIALASVASGRIRYRPRALTAADVAAMVVVCLTPVALAITDVVGDASLVWTASPLRWPTLHVAPVVALAFLAVPFTRRPVRRPTEAPVRDLTTDPVGTTA